MPDQLNDLALKFYQQALAGTLPSAITNSSRFAFIESLLNIQDGATESRSFTGYEDFEFSGLGFAQQGGAAPTLTTYRGTQKLAAFAGTGGTTNEGFFDIHLTHKLKANVNITLHLHLTHNNASPTGNAKFYVDLMVGRGYGGIFSSQFTLSTVYTPTSQYEHNITNDDDMTIDYTIYDLEPDSVILGRVYRNPADAADTFADNVFLIHVDCHVEVGQFATQERNRPFTAEGFPA